MEWSGEKPDKCDLCQSPIGEEFVDGVAWGKAGVWACMCVSCHHSNGVGLGPGRGQHYRKEGDLFRQIE